MDGRVCVWVCGWVGGWVGGRIIPVHLLSSIIMIIGIGHVYSCAVGGFARVGPQPSNHLGSNGFLV